MSLESKMNIDSKESKMVVDIASCILLDIEGTTTSIDFLRKDVLNYIIQNMQKFVVDHWDDPEVQKVVKELIIQENEGGLATCQVEDDNVNDVSKTQEAFITKLRTEMKSNEKSTAVKEFEGLICMSGFSKGELSGHLYPDVVDAFKVWSRLEKKIYIYSNGSVQSQSLLFGQSIYGDLRKYIEGNFDTNIGSKLDPASYSKICQAMEKLPNEIVFFSDRPLELYAAKQAGLNIVLVVRNPDNLTFAEEMSYMKSTDPIINSFLDILPNQETEN